MKMTQLLLTAGLTCILVVGCSKEKEPQDETPAVKETQAEDTSGGGLMDQLGDTADEVKQAAEDQLQDAIAAFQKTSADQVDNLKSQVAAMKQAALAAADEQLNGLLQQLDTKLGAAGDLVNQLTGADEATLASLKSQFNDLMGEVQGLIADAKSRMQELDITIPGG